jgi:hypothetical protein
MRSRTKAPYFMWVVALGLVAGGPGGIAAPALAGKSNLDTGEKCQGLDCAGLGGTQVPDGAGESTIRLSNVETENCNDLEINKIHFAVDWLQRNQSAVNQQMGTNGLRDWPGNSRENFHDKLRKDLKFVCISEKKKCGKLLGVVYPVVAQKRVNLCTNSIRDLADALGISRKVLYVHVVAHEVGHLVHINEHRSQCVERYTNPRFSQSLGLAAHSAYLGIDYKASDWEWACSSPHSYWDWEDIIENKKQPPPIVPNLP